MSVFILKVRTQESGRLTLIFVAIFSLSSHVVYIVSIDIFVAMITFVEQFLKRKKVWGCANVLTKSETSLFTLCVEGVMGIFTNQFTFDWNNVVCPRAMNWFASSIRHAQDLAYVMFVCSLVALFFFWFTLSLFSAVVVRVVMRLFAIRFFWAGSCSSDHVYPWSRVQSNYTLHVDRYTQCVTICSVARRWIAKQFYEWIYYWWMITFTPWPMTTVVIGCTESVIDKFSRDFLISLIFFGCCVFLRMHCWNRWSYAQIVPIKYSVIILVSNRSFFSLLLDVV